MVQHIPSYLKMRKRKKNLKSILFSNLFPFIDNIEQRSNIL